MTQMDKSKPSRHEVMVLIKLTAQIHGAFESMAEMAESDGYCENQDNMSSLRHARLQHRACIYLA